MIQIKPLSLILPILSFLLIPCVSLIIWFGGGFCNYLTYSLSHTIQANVGFISSLNYPGDALPVDLTSEETGLGRHAGRPQTSSTVNGGPCSGRSLEIGECVAEQSLSRLQPRPDPFVTLDYFPHTFMGRQYRQLQGSQHALLWHETQTPYPFSSGFRRACPNAFALSPSLAL